ncbi:hypothetical protein [Mycolicibacterium holsaticum]|nr:hypothetical protein [Mycolicibacterium holsaticum]MDA4107090.1 hypothetical protein [Mycolicibacterium holsaticum DSM 44478 = JCM 12374]
MLAAIAAIGLLLTLLVPKSGKREVTTIKIEPAQPQEPVETGAGR